MKVSQDYFSLKHSLCRFSLSRDNDTFEFLYTKQIYPRIKEKRKIKRSDLIQVQPCVEKIRFIRTKISSEKFIHEDI